MSRSLQHYLNDQCSRVLRNFPWPIRRKIKGIPPLFSEAHPSVVAVLCGPGQFLEGLWSLWSWMRQLNSMASALLLFDGKIVREDRDLFQKLFPGGRLLELNTFLEGRSLPGYLARFVAANWTGKKFAAVYELQKDSGVLYSDSDVIAFRKPEEMAESIIRGHSAYLFDRIGYDLDPWLNARAEKLGIPVTKHFNAGLVYVPRGEIKESVLEAVLSDWQPSFNTHHAEQTLFSLMLDPGHVQVLPENKYALSWQGVWLFENDMGCSNLVCRHYTGPVRHRMYLSAYPFLLKQVRSEIRGLPPSSRK